MSESLIQIEVALRGLERETPEECLNRIKYFMDEYKVEMNSKSIGYFVADLNSSRSSFPCQAG
jgi:hypothetical protein